jgi:nitrate/nitrite transporter NarK
LQSIEGKTYASARLFLEDMRQTIGASETNRLEAQLIPAARSDSLYWIAVALISLAVSAHQAWSTTIFTMVSDLFPRRATASVAGIGGMVGATIGIAANYLLGNVLMGSGTVGYFYMLLAAGSVYLVALGLIHLLTPRLEPVSAERLS